MTREQQDPPIRVGISSCLLGQGVRYDGGHKRDRFLTDILGAFVEFVPVCPEVELGLGTPRAPIRLEKALSDVRLVMPSTAADLTEAMRKFAARRVAALAEQDLCGYVLKKDSPSCGMERVKIWNRQGMSQKEGRGVFAEILIEAMPNLPVEEEGRLADPRLRENFIERLFAYRRLRNLFNGRLTIGRLVEFHTAHKLVLLAHQPEAYHSLGRLVARAKQVPHAELKQRYESEFMEALRVVATPGRHTNVLTHIAGYFKNQLDEANKRELHGVITDYRQGLVPLIVPITLLRHYVRLYDVEYLAGQVYLEPHPKELMLRNHV